MFDNMFDWFWEFLYNVARWINQLVDGIFKIFLYFSGSAPDSVNVEFSGRPDGNILKLIFDDRAIPFWLAGFTILAGAIFVISLAFGLFRTEFAEDTGKTKAKVIKSAFKGIMTLVLIPALFGIGIIATTTLFSGLVEAMAGNGNTVEDFSFAQQIFDVCVPEYDTSHGKKSWDISASALQEIVSLKNYNYVIQYIGGILVMFIIGISALNVMGRLIDIVLLYIISPFVVAITPLDEGNRLGIWKDLVFSKFLSVAGIILSYYIFFQCMNIVNAVLVGNSFIIKLSKLLFAIAGALASNKGSNVITNLVGHNTALLEGQQQSIAVSSVGHGAMLGLTAGGKILGLGFAGVKGLFGGKKNGTTATTIKGGNTVGENTVGGDNVIGGTGIGGTGIGGTGSNQQQQQTIPGGDNLIRNAINEGQGFIKKGENNE